MRAARYLKVPIWELAQQPTYWRDIALIADAAELGAEKDRQERRREMAEAEKESRYQTGD